MIPAVDPYEGSLLANEALRWFPLMVSNDDLRIQNAPSCR